VQPGPRAIEALAAALHTLASDSVLLKTMSGAARRRVVEHYLWERRHLQIGAWYRMAGIGSTDALREVDYAVRPAGSRDSVS